jgi:hypothetical protein
MKLDQDAVLFVVVFALMMVISSPNAILPSALTTPHAFVREKTKNAFYYAHRKKFDCAPGMKYDDYEPEIEPVFDETVWYWDRRGFDVGMRLCSLAIGLTVVIMVAAERKAIIVPGFSLLLEGLYVALKLNLMLEFACIVLVFVVMFPLRERSSQQPLSWWVKKDVYASAFLFGKVFIGATTLLVAIQFHRWGGPLAILVASHVYYILRQVSNPPPNNVSAWAKYYKRLSLHEYQSQSSEEDPGQDCVNNSDKLRGMLKRPVVWTCFGDGLLHGTVGASVTTLVTDKLQALLQSSAESSRMEARSIVPQRQADRKWSIPTSHGRGSLPPLAVVNCAQTGISSHTLWSERQRIRQGVTCVEGGAEYIVIWIGINDLRALYTPATERDDLYPSSLSYKWQSQVIWLNSLSEHPSWSGLKSFEHRIIKILRYIEEVLSADEASGTTNENQHKRHVALLSLPPMGEDDLNSIANRLVIDANVIIQKAVEEVNSTLDENSCLASVSVVPVHDRLVSFLQENVKSQRKGFFPKVPVDWFLPVSFLQCAVYHSWPGAFTWRSLSAPIFGHLLTTDGLHLHETGGSIAADAIVEWLLDHGIRDRL